MEDDYNWSLDSDDSFMPIMLLSDLKKLGEQLETANPKDDAEYVLSFMACFSIFFEGYAREQDTDLYRDISHQVDRIYESFKYHFSNNTKYKTVVRDKQIALFMDLMLVNGASGEELKDAMALSAIIYNLRHRYGWPIETEYDGKKIAHYQLRKGIDLEILKLPKSFLDYLKKKPRNE